MVEQPWREGAAERGATMANKDRVGHSTKSKPVRTPTEKRQEKRERKHELKQSSKRKNRAVAARYGHHA
jgi:hypothetical protein